MLALSSTRCQAERVLDELVPRATSGNKTSIEIAATPERVWEAFNELTLRELRITGALMALRSLPAVVTGRGELTRRRRPEGREPRKLVEAMASSRFVVLHLDPPHEAVLGLIGQFWKPSGGVDTDVADAEAFVAFDRPGFVKSAVGFVVEPSGAGARITTETRNQPTDAGTARRFGLYWKLVGWGSKATRLEMLRAVRRRAER